MFPKTSTIKEAIAAKKVSTETKMIEAINDKILKEIVTTVSIYKPRLQGDNKWLKDGEVKFPGFDEYPDVPIL